MKSSIQLGAGSVVGVLRKHRVFGLKFRYTFRARVFGSRLGALLVTGSGVRVFNGLNTMEPQSHIPGSFLQGPLQETQSKDI